jgi:hypothetical protein
VVKCSLNGCGKFYHLSCLPAKPKKRFMCPWHYCVQCKTTGNSKALLQCTRCPKAYHLRCYTRNVVRLNKRFIVCHQHKQPSRPPAYPSQKAQLKETVQMLKAKLNEFAAQYSCLSVVEESKEPGLKKKGKVLADDEIEAVYKKHGMEKPENVDYGKYSGEWCRFCGARRAVWQSGPWGRKTLCETHSTMWKNKKLPEVHNVEAPTSPMFPNKNTEVSYLLKLGS